MKEGTKNFENYFKALKYAKRLFLKNSTTPLYLIFFVTSKCNLRCKHCFYWRELNKPENWLSLEEIEKIARSMDYLPYLRITGGEPTMRNDFAEIPKIFYKNNKLLNLGINTNGFLTEKVVEGVKSILRECPDLNVDLCVSIDDLNKRHDENRGVPGTYKNAINTLRELNKLREKYQRLKTVIGIDVNKNNQNRLQEIYNEVKKLDVDYICDTIVRGDPKNPDVKNVDITNYEKLTELLYGYNKKRQHQAYININAKDAVVAETIIKTKTENKWWGFNCTAGINAGVIYSNGDIFPCEQLNKKIGNIKDFNYNFKELWNSQVNKEIRNYIKKNKHFCTHENFITASMFSSPTALSKVILKSLKKNYQ